jgi:hypothetical protein
VKNWYEKFKKAIEAEQQIFKSKEYHFSYRPFLFYQGIAVFVLTICILFFGAYLILPKPIIPESKVIKTANIQKISQIVVGQPVKWVAIINRKDITSQQYFLNLPKNVKNIKLKSLSANDAQKYLVSIAESRKQQLSNQERMQLTSSYKKNFQDIGTAGLLQAFLNVFSYAGRYFVADVSDAMEQLSGEVIQVDDAKLVDLKKEAKEIKKEEKEQKKEEKKEENQLQEQTTALQQASEEIAASPSVETSKGHLDEQIIPPEATQVEAPAVEPAEVPSTSTEAFAPAEVAPATPTENISDEALPSLVETVSPLDENAIQNNEDQYQDQDKVLVEYETSAPTITEQNTDSGKLVIISAQEPDIPPGCPGYKTPVDKEFPDSIQTTTPSDILPVTASLFDSIKNIFSYLKKFFFADLEKAVSDIILGKATEVAPAPENLQPAEEQVPEAEAPAAEEAQQPETAVGPATEISHEKPEQPAEPGQSLESEEVGPLPSNCPQPLTDVLAFTTIPKLYKVGEESKIKIKWKNNGNQEVTFHAEDLDADGYIDYLEWTVPHLSEQTFEIIFISKAFKLDENQDIIEDIYDTVRYQDNIWATIENGQYVRVTFEQILDSTKDITLYAKPVDSSAVVEVYAGNSDQLIATFQNIDHEGAYKVLLTNLQTPTDVFDLKITGGDLDIDWIVDPSPATFYSSASDGYAYFSNKTYATAHNSTTGILDASSAFFQIGQGKNETTSASIYRGFVFFDTSSIPSNATITSAQLSLYGYSDITSSSDFYITIQNGQPTYPHNPLVEGDYLYSQYSGNGGTFNTSGFSVEGYNDIALNADGLSWIQKGEGSETKFVLLSDRDISATQPGNYEEVKVYSNEQGEGYQPKLVVNYTIDAPTLTISDATSVATTTATLNGNITATGGEDPTVTVYWGDNDGGQTPENWDFNSAPTSPAQPQGVAVFSKDVTSLSTGTVYYFSAKATNSAGTSWPDASLSFSTHETEILRPNGAGSETAIDAIKGSAHGCSSSAHYNCVNEETTDDNTTYVYNGTENWQRDLYALSDHTGLGTINFVKVYARLSQSCPDSFNEYGKISIKTEGTVYDTSEYNLAYVWTTFSNTWATNPQTGVAWTWAEVDALEAGVSLYSTGRSLLGGTKILMADETEKYIEDIRIGDKVKSYDFDAMAIVQNTVTNIMHGRHDDYLIFNNTLKTSTNHVIYTNHGFKPAKDIQIGEYLMDATGNMIKIDSIQYIKELVDTYDVEIENTHNFFASGFLVHNQPVCPSYLGQATQVYVEVDYTPPTNSAPNAPTLVSPASGSYTYNSQPTLSASYSDPDAGTGTANYIIASSSSADCSTNQVASGTSASVSSGSNTTWAPDSALTPDSTYFWCAQNDDGTLQSAWTALGNFILDTTNPTSSISSPSDNSYFASTTVDLSGTSSDTNLQKTEISVDGGAYAATSGTADSWTYSAEGLSEGAHTFQTKATDLAGNTGTSSVVHATVDVTAPTATDNAPTDWQNSDATITFSCTDTGSGCSKVYYTTNGSTPDITSNYVDATSSWQFTMSDEGSYILNYFAKDVTGNSQTMATSAIKIDKTFPVTSDDYAVKDGQTQTSAQTITLTPSDALSGIMWTKYCTDTSNTCNPATDGKDYDANNKPIISTSGTTYFRYASEDNAGNTQTTVSRQIKIAVPSDQSDRGGAISLQFLSKTNIFQQINQLISNIVGQAEIIFRKNNQLQTINYPPIEQSVPQQPQDVFKGWNTMSIKPLVNSALINIPSDAQFFASKIPQVKNLFNQLGINFQNENQKLSGIQLSLPGISAMPKMPTDIVFAKTANDTIDFQMGLSFDNKGQAEQKIKIVVSSPLKLIIKPDKPASKVTGYFVLKSQQNSNSAPQNNFGLGALLSAINSLLVQNTPQQNTELLLQKFDYVADASGIFSAQISAPATGGEYNITTVIQYKDPSLTPKQTQLLAVVDPEGYIYQQLPQGKLRIQNATVSLYWLNSDTNKFELWPAEKYIQKNPFITDDSGRYSFLTPPGQYYMKITAPGYQDFQTDKFFVQDAGITLDIQLKKKSLLNDIILWIKNHLQF